MSLVLAVSDPCSTVQYLLYSSRSSIKIEDNSSRAYPSMKKKEEEENFRFNVFNFKDKKNEVQLVKELLRDETGKRSAFKI